MMFYNLPDKQRQALHFIVRYIDEKGQSPTHSEIADALDILPQQAHTILNALEKKGKIKRNKGAHRSIEIISGDKK